MTTMAKHNKKRNVGLIHEQLIRHIGACMVEQNQKAADIAIKILESHFSKKSELYREFRLFNSLVHTRVEDSGLAKKIISESKRACQNHDAVRLDREKSGLIKSINHQISDNGFYSRKISEYKIFSTVQALLNEWRGNGNLFPEEIAKYENFLENWLLREEKTDSIADNPNANPLVLNIMIEKFNKKYGEKFSDRQRQLLEAKIKKNKSSIVEHVKKIKHDGLSAVEKFYEGCDNKFLLSKKENVLNKIKGLQEGYTDQIVEKALSLASLISELESEDE